MTTDLLIPGQDQDPLDVIDRSGKADSTKTKYRRALQRYFDETGAPITDDQALMRHAQTLPSSGRSFLKAAVRLYTNGMANAVKAQATPENIDQVQAVLLRIDALQKAVELHEPKGKKTPTWLTEEEVRQLAATCGGDLIGRRDRVVLGLLVSAGLRREEAVNLKFDDLVLQPVKGKIRSVLAIEGKGKKQRSVPIRDEFAALLDEWANLVGGAGRVARSVGMNREIGDSLSAVALFHVVRKHGRQIGKPRLAPHDLRRTYAQIAFDAGVPITQISILLGHASVETTQRYLDLSLDLETTASDFVPWG